MKRILTIAMLVSVAFLGNALAENQISTLRGAAELDKNAQPQDIPKVINLDIRQARNYPEQPPLIPHKIDGYEVDIKVNKCLQCHERTAVEETQAPMVSVTHFIGRDGQVLAEISPRRYFCTQCHVTQQDTRLLLNNDFVDSSEIIEYLKSKGEGAQ